MHAASTLRDKISAWEQIGAPQVDKKPLSKEEKLLANINILKTFVKGDYPVFNTQTGILEKKWSYILFDPAHLKNQILEPCYQALRNKSKNHAEIHRLIFENEKFRLDLDVNRAKQNTEFTQHPFKGLLQIHTTYLSKDKKTADKIEVLYTEYVRKLLDFQAGKTESEDRRNESRIRRYLRGRKLPPIPTRKKTAPAPVKTHSIQSASESAVKPSNFKEERQKEVKDLGESVRKAYLKMEARRAGKDVGADVDKKVEIRQRKEKKRNSRRLSQPLVDSDTMQRFFKQQAKQKSTEIEDDLDWLDASVEDLEGETSGLWMRAEKSAPNLLKKEEVGKKLNMQAETTDRVQLSTAEKRKALRPTLSELSLKEHMMLRGSLMNGDDNDSLNGDDSDDELDI